MNEQDCKKLAELLFPDVDKTPDYYEEKYPYRKLPNKAEVTRLGPSPTGFIHLGNRAQRHQPVSVRADFG